MFRKSTSIVRLYLIFTVIFSIMFIIPVGRVLSFNLIGHTWPTSSVPVRVTLENVQTTSMGRAPIDATFTRADWQREIRAAMQLWNNAGTPFRFEEVPPDQAVLDIFMVPGSQLPENAAVTCFKATPTGPCGINVSGPGNFAFAEIHINADQRWVSRDSGNMNFLGVGFLWGEPDPQTIIAHELGHVLGLDESSKDPNESDLVKSNALMYPHLRQVHRWLSDDDRAGIRQLYGRVADPQPPSASTPDAAFVSDITVPDGTILSPNQQFVKTWRVRNTGSTTWDANYKLAYVSGNQLGGPSSVTMPQTVTPGQEVNINVTMMAPSATGNYRSDWRLKDSQNREFGDPVWAKISVGSTPSQPAANGIEIVAVSSHTVQPGEQFNPSVTFRLTSGQLDPARGDHLHATPEDSSNTLSAYPVQPIRRVVNSGETYTFDSNYDASFKMTAPTQPGTYQSIWQLRVGGQYIGPKVTIQVIVQQSSYQPTGWHVDYWMNKDLAGFVNWNTTDTHTYLFYNWENNSPGGGIPADSWSARFLKNVYFPGGTYRFHCQHDDGCRIYVGGQEKVNGWGGSGEHNWEGYLPAGTQEVRVEYYENTGGARMEAWWQGPGFLPIDQVCDPNQWCGEYWGNTGLIGDPAIRRNEGNGFLDRSWGSGSPGYDFPTDNFTVRWHQNVNFACGRYRFNVHSDDGIRIWVGNQQVLDEWGARGADFQRETDITAGTLPIKIEYLEVGGDASVRVTWEQLSSCQPPCPDTFEPDNFITQAHPFSIGNTESHAFCVQNDEDWISFVATAGTLYRISVLDETYPWWADVSLYKSDGTLATTYYLSGSAWKAPVTGTYYAKVRHTSGDGALSYTYKLSVIEVPELCNDAYEADDSVAQAHTFMVGSTEAHSFCVLYDSDWVKFTAKAGATYRIETLELAPWLSTRLYLYGSDGTTQVVEDAGPAHLTGSYPSVITATITTAGTYFVKAREFGNAGNPRDIYKLRITQADFLSNSGFELDANKDGKPDIWSIDNRVTRSTSLVHSGAFAMRHYATNNAGYNIYQAVSNLTAGSQYTFSGWVNIPATNDAFTFQLQVVWLNASNKSISTSIVKKYTKATGGWDNATAILLAPTGTVNAQLQMVVNSLNATVYVDDFAFVAKGNPQPNSWILDQWQNVSTFSVDNSVTHSGTRAVRISSIVENDARWTQHVAVKSSTNYVLSGWIRTTNVGMNAIGACLGLVDDWTRTPDLRGTQDWTYVDVVINSGTRTDLYIGARLGHWSNTTTGLAWFDDLALREQTSTGLGPNLLQNASFEQ